MRIRNTVIQQSGSAHFQSEYLPTHGPQSWPWWKPPIACSIVPVDLQAPSFGKRLWVYTPKGAWFAEVLHLRAPDPS